MTAPVQSARTGSQIPLLLLAVFLVYLGQMTLNPIIAPLADEVGLDESQIGATISVAAVMVVLTSQLWGRRSQSWGRKPVLVVAFALAALALGAFAIVSYLGMIGVLTGIPLFILFLLLRGVGFGAAIAAVPPTAQAYIADVTTDEQARVKGMAGVGAVQGLAMVGGSIVGGVLSIFGLLTPLIVIPILLLAGLLLVIFGLRRETRTELIENPVTVKPFDPRVWPFLVAGFGMFTALGFIQIITGFIVQDRLGLSSEQTGFVTGGALLAAGVGMIIAQTVIVPRSGWLPPTLLRVGGAIAVAGFVLLIFDLGVVGIIAAILLIGVGLGIATPGYTAGPTLVVNREEQGGLAGLIGATNGLTFVIAPVTAGFCYRLWPPLPIIIGAVIMAFVTIFVFVHPRFREVGQR